ncbi:MAG: DUF1566 domain-containing protein [Deltaproteobacteria bacterium]|nr:DUF1566 domain-containing protein [Deltaproteobacteria bacterium]
MGATECTGGQLRTCQADGNGCRSWTSYSSCASGWCSSATACGVCNHACATVGATECTGGQLRTCQTDGNGCRAWSGYTTCASGSCATATTCGGCQASPRPAPTEWATWLAIPTSPPLSAYTITTNTVLDSQTCLMWQRNVSSSTYSWQEAKNYCSNLVLATYSDWRLPTTIELQSILDRSTEDPTVNTTAFPNTPTEEWFWSSSPDASDGSSAWRVYFRYGYSSLYSQSVNGYARCVR